MKHTSFLNPGATCSPSLERFGHSRSRPFQEKACGSLDCCFESFPFSSGVRARGGGTRIMENGRGAGDEKDQQQATHSPVLEEEDLPTDLSDAIKDDVLCAQLRSDWSQRGGGAGASASIGVRGHPWGTTPDLRLGPAPGLLPTRPSAQGRPPGLASV